MSLGMEYVKLGRTNLMVGRLSLGALCFGDPKWRPYVLAEEESRAVIRRALDHGFNLIDTSNYYSLGASEEIVGRAIRDFVPREEIILSTKGGNPMTKAPNRGGYSRKNLFAAVDASLKRLGTDHIDIYQMHIWNSASDLEEVVTALDDLVRSGKVLYTGVTILPVWQLVSCVMMARYTGRTGFSTVSNHYNLLWREDERELLPFCRHENLGVISHSPFARGLLCGRARREGPGRRIRSHTDEYADFCYHRQADLDLADLVETVAQERGTTAAKVALAWVLSNPGIHSVLIGATRPEHIGDAVDALSIRLTPEESKRLEDAYLLRPSETR